ncbi:hypothetical protein YC2023_037156 [Brassica napus]
MAEKNIPPLTWLIDLAISSILSTSPLGHLRKNISIDDWKRERSDNDDDDHEQNRVLTDSTINHEEEQPDSTRSLNRQSLRQAKDLRLPIRDLMSLYNAQYKDLES